MLKGAKGHVGQLVSNEVTKANSIQIIYLELRKRRAFEWFLLCTLYNRTGITLQSLILTCSMLLLTMFRYICAAHVCGNLPQNCRSILLHNSYIYFAKLVSEKSYLCHSFLSPFLYMKMLFSRLLALTSKTNHFSCM